MGSSVKTRQNCAWAYFINWPLPNLAISLIQHRVAEVLVMQWIEWPLVDETMRVSTSIRVTLQLLHLYSRATRADLKNKIVVTSVKTATFKLRGFLRHH